MVRRAALRLLVDARVPEEQESGYELPIAQESNDRGAITRAERSIGCLGDNGETCTHTHQP